MISKIKTLNISQKLSLYVCISLIIRTLNIMLNEIFYLTNATDLILKFFLIIIFFTIDTVLFFSINSDGKKKFIISELIGFILLLITTLRYPSLGLSAFISYGWLLISFIPLIISFFYIEDLNVLYLYIYKTSFIITLFCILIYLFHTSNLSTNLVFSYTLLFAFLIHICKFMKEKNIVLFFLIIIEGFMLLTYGSRGTIICIVAFFVLFLIHKIGIKSLKYLLVLSIILVALYQVLYHSGFFSYIYEYFDNQGKYIRILDLISSGNFFNNNGRFLIYNQYFNYILEKPIFGWGIGADLLVGIFPHNVIIEIIFNFGIFSLILFYLVFKLVRNYYKTYLKKDTNNIFLILLCSGVLPLFFSTTYLEWMYFWIFIGFLLSIYKIGIKNK